jgi:hypothetical protein
MSHFKSIIGFTLKITLTILISFLVLEFLLLVFNDMVFRNTFFMYDPDMGFKVRPYAQWGDNRANEFGFNDRDYPHEKPPGTFRILVLSDSFNWAGGLENNYTSILERKFQAEFGSQVEVINAGYSQTHTGEQLIALEKYGLQYNPDLVVLGFFVGNDFFDAQPWRKRIVIGGTTTDIDTHLGHEITFLGQPLVWRSRLYLFLEEQWTTYQFLRHVEAQVPVAQSSNCDDNTQSEDCVTVQQSVSLPTDDYLVMELARMQIANWNMDSAFEVNKSYAFKNLLAMRDVLVERDIQFVVVAYPDEFQIDETLRQAIVEKYEIDLSVYQIDRPQGLLWQFCTENNIEYYDLLPMFQKTHQQGQHLYLPNDSHWNKAGNELAAQALFDILIWKTRE